MSGDRPNILVFPPLASVVAPLSAIALEWLWPPDILPPAFTASILIPGLAILVLSGFLAVAGARAFKAAETNIDPRQPALRIVRDGPYRFTRNPMYLGMVLFQIGLGLTFSLDWTAVTAPILWAVLHWGVVLPEETYLGAKFGKDYEALLAETRRWL